MTESIVPSSSDLIAPDWIKIAFRVAVPDVERAEMILEQFCAGHTVVEWLFRQGEDFGAAEVLPDTEASVRAYVPVGQWPQLEPNLHAALQQAGWPDATARLHVTPQRREEWETAWHQHVQLIRTGRLVIRPRPIQYQPTLQEIVVDLEPGLAFGTGSHPSTRGALVAMERSIRLGDWVLDFGSGSGILSCAAARLGAARVDAIDIDPLAITATQHCATLNGVESIVRVLEASEPTAARLPQDPAACYHVVVANISAGAAVEHAAALAAITRPGGVCILGGIVDTQLERVERALAETPLRIQEIDADDEWRIIRASPPASVSG